MYKMTTCMIFILLITSSTTQVKSENVLCENIGEFLRWIIVGELKTCHLQENTAISSNRASLSNNLDSTVEGLTFQGNKKVFYLPVRVSEKFPNLIVLDAGDCSIKSVSFENFIGLTKLQQLFLCCNQIERINTDTFKDLSSLQLLGLDKNKLKFINGETFFDGLTNLKGVWMNQNDCIDQDFFNPNLKRLQTVVNDKCGIRTLSFNFKCGQVLFGKGNVVGGNQTQRGQWPFLASLYSVELDSHICGGSLISHKHVITAAHCIKNKQQVSERLPGELIVLLGKYNLARIELESVQSGVKEIRIHPNWRAFTEDFDSDIAILLLKKVVEFSMFIQPVCLPIDDNTNNVDGFVAGWGRSEFTGQQKHELIPRQAPVEAISDSLCYTTNPAIALISSVNTFCGSGKGAGPCNGDSGGGLFVKIENDWTLKGIISSALSTGTQNCGVETFSVYTNVVKFLNWISDVVKETSE